MTPEILSLKGQNPESQKNESLKEALEYLMFFPKELKKELEKKKKSSSSPRI